MLEFYISMLSTSGVTKTSMDNDNKWTMEWNDCYQYF